MIPIEQGVLADALLELGIAMGETQAMIWAKKIIDLLDEDKCDLVMRDSAFVEHPV
jgi:hypothetical protein